MRSQLCALGVVDELRRKRRVPISASDSMVTGNGYLTGCHQVCPRVKEQGRTRAKLVFLGGVVSVLAAPGVNRQRGRCKD